MKSVVYAPAALDSFDDILEYTADTFGEAQAVTYTEQLVARIEALAAGAGPRARLVGLFPWPGALLGVALGLCQGKGTGEHGLFRELHEVLMAGDLMLADSDYCTYFLLAMMQNRGVDVVFEQHGARKTDFRRGQSIGIRDHVVQAIAPGLDMTP